MNASQILDQLLQSGKELAGQARIATEKGMGIPASGSDRATMLSGLGKGAVAGGLLTLLLGTRSGRSIAGKTVKYGSLAAVAAVAYNALQAWQANAAQPPANAGQGIIDLAPEHANTRAELLVRAMIAAANADGHIDEAERTNILQQIKTFGLPAQTASLIEREITRPCNANELAREVDSMAAASEVYLLSSLIIDDANPAERQYLVDLAAALHLPPDLVNRLHGGK